MNVINWLSTEQDELPPAGMYSGVPFDEYLSWPYVSNSSLKHCQSMAHYNAHRGRVTEETKAMRLGTLLHAGRLEPLTVALAFAVMPPFHDDPNNQTLADKPTTSKNTKYYRESKARFEGINQDKCIVTLDEYNRMLGMVESLAANEKASEYLNARGHCELSIVWTDPDTGVRCKARLDKWSDDDGQITDLKSTKDCTDFARTMAKFSYHRQGAMYTDGMQVLTGIKYDFHIVAVESEFPFGCMAAPVSEEALSIGRMKYKEALQQIAECQESRVWPGYQNPDKWILPSWAMKQHQDDAISKFTLGGESVL